MESLVFQLWQLLTQRITQETARAAGVFESSLHRLREGWVNSESTWAIFLDLIWRKWRTEMPPTLMSNRFDAPVPITAVGQGHPCLAFSLLLPTCCAAQSLYLVLMHTPCSCPTAFSEGLEVLELLQVSVFHQWFEPSWWSFSCSRREQCDSLGIRCSAAAKE